MARLGGPKKAEVRVDKRGKEYGVGGDGRRISAKEARRRIAISEGFRRRTESQERERHARIRAFAVRRERTKGGTFEPLPEFRIEVEVRDDYSE